MFEKKRGKRFLASVMALVMLLSLAPVGALATEDEGQPAENQAVAQPAVTDEEDTTNTSIQTYDSYSRGQASISVSIKETKREECDVYYAETFTKSRQNTSTDTTLKVFDEDGQITYSDSDKLVKYGVVFFVKPHDGYALKYLNASGSASIYNSIVDNSDIYQTSFWTSDSQVTNLKSAGFTKEQIYNLINSAKQKGCVAAFIFTRSSAIQGDITTNLDFLTEKLATFEKKIVAVTQGNNSYTGNELKSVKVREGDTITYSFEVTFYPGDNKITYENVKVTDDLLGAGNSTILFENPTANKTETKTETRDYIVTAKDLRTGTLENTATLTYDYKAPYNEGNVTSEATATATIATVSAVSYQYDDGPRPSDATDVTTGDYAPTEHSEGERVTVAADPTGTGYDFNGWTAENASVNNEGKFTMPNAPVIFTGSWTAKNDVGYTVHYYKQGTTEEVSEDKIVEGQTFNTGVTEEAPAVTGYTVVGSDKETMTLDAYGKEITFYYTQNEPITDTVDAKYFILTPSITAPTDGSSQGTGNYFPNDSDCGGVEGKETSTGYPGKIKSNLLTDHPTADTQAGYADTTNGIGTNYLVLPGDLGYFSGKNYTNGKYNGYNKDNFPNVLKNLVGEGNQFDMNNYEIVWYVAKKEADGYHVDGYLKGVSIQLKYFDNFNGATTEVDSQNWKSGDKVTIKGKNIITGADSRTGWIFKGWATNANGDGEVYQPDQKKTLITSTSLYAKWTTTYKVVTRFMDADGTEQKNFERTNENLTGAHGKLLSELVVKPDMTDITGNYVYVPSETKYSINDGNKVPVGNATFTEANTVIHQYYYLDETGKIGKDEENKPTDESDKIPDAWQYKVTFKVVNGSWDNKTNEAIVKYVTKKDAAGNNSATGTATLSDVPAVGNEPNSGYRASGSWDETPSVGLEIKKDTEFTFTYFRRSSGGSSRPSTPTVTIPDDVPTGLNGKDHYAYIIGYGNNDVRPQNNITRAEVATIFFRLLTDETREANMTKSNGYNDVKDGDWFCCAVSTLSKMGIIKGYEDGSFKPNDPISRAEFAAIAARFDPDGDKTPATFADVTSHWAKDEISIAANHGWIKGYEDGSFKPDQKITRAETMTLVNRVLNRLPEAKDDLHKDMKTWVDNMDETAWYYLAVQEATNSHYFKNKTGTKFEQWTDLRDTRDWSELEK